MVYLRRVVDAELDELSSLPAVALEGAKGVGKTATAERRAHTIVRLDEDDTAELAKADPTRILVGPGPVLLDEWQRVPAVWDTVRRAVDDGEPPGPFLLTGSATPPDGQPETARHSGAGRIDALHMRPMALPERLDLGPSASLSAMLKEGGQAIAGETDFGLEDYAIEIIRSGFPGFRRFEGRAGRSRLDGYLNRVIDRDIESEIGQRVRRPDTLRRWLTAYAAATATTTSLEKIRDAATSGQATPAKTTVIAYRDALARLFILDPVEGWLPHGSQLRRLTQAPKHHLVDPALAARLLGLTEEKLLGGEGALKGIPLEGAFLGYLFESLVTLSVRVFAQAAEARTFHLRTHRGEREIDLIVESSSGRVLAFEVKLSATVDDRDVKHLKWLKSEIGDRLSDAAVITTGRYAYRRRDGIAVIPLALLGG